MYYKISMETISGWKATLRHDIDFLKNKAYSWYDDRFESLNRDFDNEYYQVDRTLSNYEKIIELKRDRFRILKSKLNKAYDSYIAELKEIEENFDFFMSVIDFTHFDSSNVGTRTYIDFRDWTIEHKKEPDVDPQGFEFKVINREIRSWDWTLLFSMTKVKFDRYN